MPLSPAEKTVFAAAKLKLEGLLGIASADLPEPNKAGKGLEYYALAMLIDAVQMKYGAVTHRRANGALPNKIVLRQQPNSLPATIRRYSWFTFDVPSQGGLQRYEMHNGVNAVGSSGATHELDVCIIQPANTSNIGGQVHTQDVSSYLATGGVVPVYAGIECKFTAGGVLDRNQGRSFLGVRVDALVSHSVFITTAHHNDLAPHRAIDDILGVNWQINGHQTNAVALFDVSDPVGYAFGLAELTNMI